MQVRTGAERQLGTARDQLGSTAAYAYMFAPGGDSLSLLPGDSTAADRERELLAASIDHQQQQVAHARDALEGATANLGAAQQALAGAQQTATDQDDQVAASSSALADANSELSAATIAEGRPTTATSWQLSLEGPSAFTADELAQWYDAQGHGSRASVSIADLVGSYIDQGNAEGIRGDMAFAQSIHETGWFANADTITANNFAGIGHCSACAGGIPFATADIGVLAQIQLLKSYAETDPTYNSPRADPSLTGPPGCCQTWTKLGGVWASDPNYGLHILAYYAGMLEWLVAKRSTAT